MHKCEVETLIYRLLRHRRRELWREGAEQRAAQEPGERGQGPPVRRLQEGLRGRVAPPAVPQPGTDFLTSAIIR